MTRIASLIAAIALVLTATAANAQERFIYPYQWSGSDYIQLLYIQQSGHALLQMDVWARDANWPDHANIEIETPTGSWTTTVDFHNVDTTGAPAELTPFGAGEHMSHRYTITDINVSGGYDLDVTLYSRTGSLMAHGKYRAPIKRFDFYAVLCQSGRGMPGINIWLNSFHSLPSVINSVRLHVEDDEDIVVDEFSNVPITLAENDTKSGEALVILSRRAQKLAGQRVTVEVTVGKESAELELRLPNPITQSWGCN